MERIPANTQIHEHTLGSVSLSVRVGVRVGVKFWMENYDK